MSEGNSAAPAGAADDPTETLTQMSPRTVSEMLTDDPPSLCNDKRDSLVVWVRIDYRLIFSKVPWQSRHSVVVGLTFRRSYGISFTHRTHNPYRS